METSEATQNVSCFYLVHREVEIIEKLIHPPSESNNYLVQMRQCARKRPFGSFLALEQLSLLIVQIENNVLGVDWYIDGV